VRLNFPVLDLPAAEETLAFRAVDTILRNDPALKAATKLHLSWKGDVEDIWNPSVSTCPFLRITPIAGPSRRETETEHRMPLDIEIMAAVLGSNSDNITNYWACIRRALFPQNSVSQLNAVLAVIAKAQSTGAMISRAIITSQGYGVVANPKNDGDRITWAKGMIQLVMLVSTP
jgi:hypothetical protein